MARRVMEMLSGTRPTASVVCDRRCGSLPPPRRLEKTFSEESAATARNCGLMDRSGPISGRWFVAPSAREADVRGCRGPKSESEPFVDRSVAMTNSGSGGHPEARLAK